MILDKFKGIRSASQRRNDTLEAEKIKNKN